MTDQEAIEQAERIARATKHFHFTGQPVSEWPNWMIFHNYAYDGHSTIILHLLFEGRLEVRLGDTVSQKAAGQVTILRNNILQFRERVSTLEPSEPLMASEERVYETKMSL